MTKVATPRLASRMRAALRGLDCGSRLPAKLASPLPLLFPAKSEGKVYNNK